MTDMTVIVDTTTCTTPALGKSHLSVLVSSALECRNTVLKRGDKSGDAGNARYDTHKVHQSRPMHVHQNGHG
jgi:hypothetical protein